MNRWHTALAGWLLLAGCQPTGVVLTVLANQLTAEQLRVTAAFDGKTTVGLRPPQPSSVPLQFPEDLFAEFDARSLSVTFTVEALDQGQSVAQATLPPLQIVAGRAIDAEVDLTPPPMAMPDMNGRYAAVVLADAPLAYYRLGEGAGTTAFDSSGHGLHGSYGRGVTRAASGLISGDSDGAAVFNGGNPSQDAIVTVPSSLALEPTQAVSVELWFRQTVFNPDDTLLLVYDDSSRGHPPYGVDMFQGALAILLDTTAGNANSVNLTNTKPAIGQACHYVETYDGQQIRLYVNGVLEQSAPFSGNLSGYGNGSGLGIGGSTANVGEVFAGAIDEVAIYGAALTPAQVQAHYSAGAGKPTR
jgi:hypothetical protein